MKGNDHEDKQTRQKNGENEWRLRRKTRKYGLNLNLHNNLQDEISKQLIVEAMPREYWPTENEDKII